MAVDGQVYFHRWLFIVPVRPPRCTSGSLGPMNGINKDVSGTRLLPMTVSTYPVNWVCFCHLHWRHSTVVCVLMEGTYVCALSFNQSFYQSIDLLALIRGINIKHCTNITCKMLTCNDSHQLACIWTTKMSTIFNTWHRYTADEVSDKM